MRIQLRLLISRATMCARSLTRVWRAVIPGGEQMADQTKTTWGCSDVIWLLVLTFNIGFFVGIPLLGKLVGQNPEKMHWGLKLLGIPFGLIIAWLALWGMSKSEVLATPVIGIALTIFLMIKGLYF